MAKIEILAPFILSWEGGFSDHPADRGGATNKGVTIATWRKQGYDKNGDGKIDVKDLKLITEKDAINVVMKPHYWNRWKGDDIRCQSLANILVDWVWGSGAHGIIEVQKMLGVKADGIVGAKTLEALNAKDTKLFFAEVKKRRIAFLQGIVRSMPSQKIFLKGWMNRLNCINYGSLTSNKEKNAIILFEDV